jgi:hypothetical protein
MIRRPGPGSFAAGSFACALAAALLLLLLRSSLAAAQLLGFVDPGLRWRTLDTEHFSVHFAEQNRPQARVAAQVAEKVYPRITGMLRWQPRAHPSRRARAGLDRRRPRGVRRVGRRQGLLSYGRSARGP